MAYDLDELFHSPAADLTAFALGPFMVIYGSAESGRFFELYPLGSGDRFPPGSSAAAIEAEYCDSFDVLRGGADIGRPISSSEVHGSLVALLTESGVRDARGAYWDWSALMARADGNWVVYAGPIDALCTKWVFDERSDAEAQLHAIAECLQLEVMPLRNDVT